MKHINNLINNLLYFHQEYPALSTITFISFYLICCAILLTLFILFV